MANKPKPEPGYPTHEDEDPDFPNKLKLDIIASQEKPTMNHIEPDDDDPDFEGLDIKRKPKPGEQVKKPTPPTQKTGAGAKDSTQNK